MPSCEGAVAKTKQAVVLNRRAGQLGVLLAVYSISFKPTFDVVNICTASTESEHVYLLVKKSAHSYTLQLSRC